MAEKNQMIKEDNYVQITEIILCKDQNNNSITVYPNTIGRVIHSSEQYLYMTKPSHDYKVLLCTDDSTIINVKHEQVVLLTEKELDHYDEIVHILFSFISYSYSKREEQDTIHIAKTTRLKIKNFLSFNGSKIPVFVYNKKYYSLPYEFFITVEDLKELVYDLSTIGQINC
jgi:hypothetical protein